MRNTGFLSGKKLIIAMFFTFALLFAFTPVLQATGISSGSGITVVANAADGDELQTTIIDGARAIFDLARAIATPIAIAAIAVALIMSWLSHDEKKIGMSRSIAKGVAATWVVLMILGYIFNFASNKLVDSNKANDMTNTMFENGGGDGGGDIK